MPLVIAAADKPAGSFSSTIGITPSQGAIIFAATIQAAAVVGRTIGITLAPGWAATAKQDHVRTIGVAATTGWAATGRQVHQRQLGVTSAAPSWTVAATQLVQRTLDVLLAPSWAATGDAPAAGVVQRTIGVTLAPGWLATGSQVHVRQLGATLAALWSVVGRQTHQRAIGILANPRWSVGSLAARPPRANYTTTATGAIAVPSTIVAGNLEPDLLVPLVEPHATIPGTRQPIDLTGLVSVRLRWSVPGATADVFLPAEVYGLPTLGLVAHTWSPGETDTPGLHRYRVELTWAGGEVQTVPSDSTSYTLLVSPAEISAVAG